jgi:hypothetical protein
VTLSSTKGAPSAYAFWMTASRSRWLGSLPVLALLAACGSSDDGVLFDASATAGSSGADAGSSGGAETAGTGGADGGKAGGGATTTKGGSDAGKSGNGGSPSQGGSAGASGKGGSAGASSGGASAGGANAGGAGGTSSGGANAGGTSSGGANAGGASSGGANAGGTSSGGASAGGSGGTNGGGANAGGGGAGGTCQDPPAVVYAARPRGTNLQLLVDNSGSMAAGVCPETCALGCCTATESVFDLSTAAIHGFVSGAPATPELDVGLSRLPSANNGCPAPNAPLVPLAPLPGNATPLFAKLDALTTDGSSTTGPGIEGASTYVAGALVAQPDEGRGIVFFTDGTGANCGADGDTKGLKSAAASLVRGVPVYVLAVFPSSTFGGPNQADVSATNALAKAGGTNEAIGVNAGDKVPAGLTAGLESIRRRAFSCAFDVTPPKGSFDPNNADVSFAGEQGKVSLQRVNDLAACQPNGYFLTTAGSLRLCPAVCEVARKQSAPAVEVSIVTPVCAP